MAGGVVDILLRLKGDARSAINAIDGITDSLKRTETQAKRTDEELAKIGERRGAAAANRQIGGAAGPLGDVGALGTQLGGIATLIAGIVTFYQQAAQWLDKQFGINKQVDVGIARSPSELAGALQSAGGTRLGDLFTPANWLRKGVLFGGENVNARRRVEEQIRDLAASDPYALQTAIPYLQDARGEYARDYLSRMQSAQAWRASLQPPSGAGNTYVTNQLPVGYDPRYVNRSMDNYNRINGRSGLLGNLPST